MKYYLKKGDYIYLHPELQWDDINKGIAGLNITVKEFHSTQLAKKWTNQRGAKWVMKQILNKGLYNSEDLTVVGIEG